MKAKVMYTDVSMEVEILGSYSVLTALIFLVRTELGYQLERV